MPYLVRKQFSKTANCQKPKDDAEDEKKQKKSDGSTNHGQCLHQFGFDIRWGGQIKMGGCHFKSRHCIITVSPLSFTLPELLISSRDEPLLQLAQERSCWNDHRGDMSEAYHGGKLRCYVHIMDEGLCYRVNTLAAYIEANRLVSLSSRTNPDSNTCHMTLN